MSRAAESKIYLFAALFGWVPAVVLGGVVRQLTPTHWPEAVFAVAWLGVLVRTVRRHAD